jgi:hypothetical protein
MRQTAKGSPKVNLRLEPVIKCQSLADSGHYKIGFGNVLPLSIKISSQIILET